MRHGFLNEIADGIRESMEEMIAKCNEYACFNYEPPSGVIEVYVNSKNDTEVIVSHDDDRGREHPNIINAVEEIIPDWSEVYNAVMEDACVDPYWNDHGFSSAVNFETWKYGHGGLR